MTELAIESGVAQQPSRVNLAPKSMRFWLMAHKIAAGVDVPVADGKPSGPDACGAFVFTVAGNSMSGAGIMDGDKVVVDRSVAPAHGRLVLALVGAQYSLKRLFHFNGRYELRTENEAMPPQRIQTGTQAVVWGVVVGVIRNYAA